jgi:hypothetical protein
MKLTPNIGTAGRVARLLTGLVLGFFAYRNWPDYIWVTALGAGALLCFFQAYKGWCWAKACGWKPPL